MRGLYAAYLMQNVRYIVRSDCKESVKEIRNSGVNCVVFVVLVVINDNDTRPGPTGEPANLIASDGVTPHLTADRICITKTPVRAGAH